MEWKQKSISSQDGNNNKNPKKKPEQKNLWEDVSGSKRKQIMIVAACQENSSGSTECKED